MVIIYVLLGSNLMGAERSEPSDVSASLTTWCPLVQEVYSNVLLNLADVGDNEVVHETLFIASTPEDVFVDDLRREIGKNWTLIATLDLECRIACRGWQW